MSSIVNVRSDTDPDLERSIRWVQVGGEWEALAVFPDPEKNYRLPDLDAIDLGQIFATTQQYLAGELPMVYLQPRH